MFMVLTAKTWNLFIRCHRCLHTPFKTLWFDLNFSILTIGTSNSLIRTRYGCLLCVQSLISVLLSSFHWCVDHHVILGHVIQGPDGINLCVLHPSLSYFKAILALCEGNPSVTRPTMQRFNILLLAWINCWTHSQVHDDRRCHGTHVTSLMSDFETLLHLGASDNHWYATRWVASQ